MKESRKHNVKIAQHFSIYRTGKRAFIKAMNSNPGIVKSTAFTEVKDCFQNFKHSFLLVRASLNVELFYDSLNY